MKPGQVKELAARWRSPEYDKPYRGPAFCADELEQAEREAVGQDPVLECGHPKSAWHEGYLSTHEKGEVHGPRTHAHCRICAALAAPRPEASTRLREALTAHEYLHGGCLCRNFKLPIYGKEELEEFRAYGRDWLQDIRWHYWLEHFMAALAAQPEPPAPAPLFQIFEDWFDNWDCTKDSEVRRLCKISWEVSRKEYHGAAQPEQEKPNPFIVNAVRLAYYTGDFKGAIDVIAEAVGENLLVSGQLPKEGSD